MKRYFALIAISLFMVGCATTASRRYSFREIKEYGEVMKIAESTNKAGLLSNEDLSKMQIKFQQMLKSYLENPGADSYEESARKAAEAAQWNAAANMMAVTQPVPVYQPPPMSPDQYNAMSGQWFHLPQH